MLPTLLEPGPLMQSLIGHEKEVVTEALRSLKQERERVVNPDPAVVLPWVIDSDARVAEMLNDCIVGESKPDIDSLARAMKAGHDGSGCHGWRLAVWVRVKTLRLRRRGGSQKGQQSDRHRPDSMVANSSAQHRWRGWHGVVARCGVIPNHATGPIPDEQVCGKATAHQRRAKKHADELYRQDPEGYRAKINAMIEEAKRSLRNG